MTRQHPLTLIVPVKKDRIADLNQRLEKIRREIHAGTEKEFRKMTTLHYARWFILNRDSFRDEPLIPVHDRLVFSSNFDGHINEHLAELSTVLSSYVDQLYDCCEGYPESENRNPETRMTFLKSCMIKTSAFFVGAPGRTVKQIRQEKKLHDFIQLNINKTNWDNNSAVEIHRHIREMVDSKPEFEWTKQQAPTPREQWFVLALYGLLILVVLPFMILWILYIFFVHELRDKYKPTKLSDIPDKLVNRLVEDEDLFPQNQFTQVAVMKPGIVRYLNFQIWMLRTRVLAGRMFVRGKLLNIPTIHFARWVLFDRNKHVMFFSNFDGNWQQYLGDFIDQSGWGLSGIFSNTANFPTTRFMVTGGAYDEAHFLAWSRSTQIPTQVWYCPYPELSIKNINNNTKIRNELRENLNEKQARLFLKRF